jgi:hypothetical protein
MTADFHTFLRLQLAEKVRLTLLLCGFGALSKG